MGVSVCVCEAVWVYEARFVRRVSFIRRLSRSSFPRRRRTIIIQKCVSYVYIIILCIGMPLRLVWDNTSGSLHTMVTTYYMCTMTATMHMKSGRRWPWGSRMWHVIKWNNEMTNGGPIRYNNNKARPSESSDEYSKHFSVPVVYENHFLWMFSIIF